MLQYMKRNAVYTIDKIFTFTNSTFELKETAIHGLEMSVLVPSGNEKS